jgi:hypothetical protein
LLSSSGKSLSFTYPNIPYRIQNSPPTAWPKPEESSPKLLIRFLLHPFQYYLSIYAIIPVFRPATRFAHINVFRSFILIIFARNTRHYVILYVDFCSFVFVSPPEIETLPQLRFFRKPSLYAFSLKQVQIRQGRALHTSYTLWYTCITYIVYTLVYMHYIHRTHFGIHALHTSYTLWYTCITYVVYTLVYMHYIHRIHFGIHALHTSYTLWYTCITYVVHTLVYMHYIHRIHFGIHALHTSYTLWYTCFRQQM